MTGVLVRDLLALLPVAHIGANRHFRGSLPRRVPL